MAAPTFTWSVTCKSCGWKYANVVKSDVDTQVRHHRVLCERSLGQGVLA